MESLLFAAAPVAAYKISGGTRKLQNFALFVAIMFAVTLSIMYYRCKVASPSDDKGNKPEVNIYKAYIPLIPLFLWALAVYLFPYLVRFHAPIPIISVMILVTSLFGLFVVSLFFYTSAIRFGAVPQCYPSLVDQFFSVLKWFWPF